ncbi:siphovirus Gp157 family protein [Chitinimonas arctica]|uniref:Siphovirus Gp157 family protein n=1 Tax=Chitinimonas arctica TaxID=2594795 RepID=A0A516SJC7_9NEIS|nr:siphovirus Gp157 family protein [Chitinimonas arctica]QDQ28272.1 siphovirus Gp157 family protein [Chitinimonas arctica]
MTALYVLAKEYRTAAEKLADLDLPPEMIADTLEGLAGALEHKATNVAMFIRNLEANVEAIKGAEKQMAERRRAMESRAENLRDYLKGAMQATQISVIESPYFKVAIRSNPESVVIDATSQIPAEFMRRPDPPPAQPDKKLIAEAIKAGRDVPGAHLARGQRLDIR